MSEEITEQAWNEWCAHPVTKAFFDTIREERNAVRDAIPNVNPSDQPDLIGKIQRLKALEDLLDVDLGGEE